MSAQARLGPGDVPGDSSHPNSPDFDNMDKMTSGKWFTAYNYHSDIPGRAMVQIMSDAPVDPALFDCAIIGEAAIAIPATGLHPASVIEAEANARVMAASKVLLEALRSLVAAVDSGSLWKKIDAMSAARVAIEDATGERQR